jgi:hypothetical protein
MTAPAAPTYRLAPDGQSITCLVCGRTSHHPRDVAERYCGHCHRFHDDHGFLAIRVLPDGRFLGVMPLLYGRARLGVSGPIAGAFADEW